jgi:hypothetical protein
VPIVSDIQIARWVSGVTLLGMFRVHHFVLAAALLPLGSLQTRPLPSPPTPTLVYKLHASKQTHAVSHFARTPDGALLVFAPQSRGHWVLIRLTDLGLASPHEEQLIVMGFTPDQLQADDAKGRGSIDVSPDGHYAVVRTQTWKIGPLPTVELKEARATLAVVDLQTYTIVSARSTTDTMYAGSFWAFNKAGVLITESNPTSTGKPGHFNQAYAITHKAVALLLPDLQPSLTCNYTEVFGPASYAGTSSRRDKSVSDVSGSCAELVRLAGASSVEDIYHADPTLYRVAERLHFNPQDFAYDPKENRLNGCQIEDLSVGQQFALYACHRGHWTWYDTVKYTALSLSVVSVPDGREILSVPLPVKPADAAIIVTIAGRDYLAVLEDGVNLSVYRL